MYKLRGTHLTERLRGCVHILNKRPEMYLLFSITRILSFKIYRIKNEYKFYSSAISKFKRAADLTDLQSKPALKKKSENV